MNLFGFIPLLAPLQAYPAVKREYPQGPNSSTPPPGNPLVRPDVLGVQE